MQNHTEIENRRTAIGDLELRHQPLVGDPDRYFVEIRHNGLLLMSSGTNFSEIALATECLGELEDRRSNRRGIEVLVGGLGLGYTADAALSWPGVTSVTVIEFLPVVLDWHRRGLIPLGRKLLDDPCCTFVEGDFFSLIGAEGHPRKRKGSGDGSRGSTGAPGGGVSLGKYDAILLDIDDAPDRHLHAAHADFYRPVGLRKLAAHLKPGGVFGLWSCDPPAGEPYEDTLGKVFTEVRVHPVPHHDETFDFDDEHLVYVAKGVRSEE